MKDSPHNPDIIYRRSVLSSLLLLTLFFWSCFAEVKQRTVLVEDDQVVILSDGRAVALLKVTNQRLSPRAMDFQCIWREDGLTTFDATDKNVFRDGKKDSDKVAFGPFVVGWSVEGSGKKGWLLIDRFPGGRAMPVDMNVHVTKHSDFTFVTEEEIKSAKATKTP